MEYDYNSLVDNLLQISPSYNPENKEKEKEKEKEKDKAEHSQNSKEESFKVKQ